jgi:pimeloyl-ACP methyl ester carboxylesterase
MTIALVIIATLGHAARTNAGDQSRAIELSRQYLAVGDKAERAKLTEKLAGYRGEFQPVLDALSRSDKFEPVEAGYIPAQHFRDTELQKKHPDDLLYFNVPKSYQPDRPTGLIFFMHGGGRTTPRDEPRFYMNTPDQGEIGKHGLPRQIGDVLTATGMIAVGPSAPWDENSPSRWCIGSGDEYVADVIAECKQRFNIDGDRVFLIGHSMGGFGAFHHMQRQPDRFATIIAVAGSWRFAYLPAVRGTKLCVIQAINDAQPNERPHFTDIEYGRQTKRLLSAKQIDHVYFEHDGKHEIRFSRDDIAKYLASAKDLRRDAFPRQIALASPVGFKLENILPMRHNRWLTLDEATDGEFELDELVSNGSQDFDKWRLDHRTAKRPGASIEAFNRGDNTIDVTTQNVKRFTVWLHPKMIDVTKPVTITVNSKPRFAEKVTPSLATALESYERRADWGLIYPIKVEVDVLP